MKDTLKDMLIRYFTYGMLGCIVIVGAVRTYPEYRRSNDLRKRDAELQQVIDRKQLELNRLKTFQKRIRNDPDFIEAIARQNHCVFPGELMFIFEDETGRK